MSQLLGTLLTSLLSIGTTLFLKDALFNKNWEKINKELEISNKLASLSDGPQSKAVGKILKLHAEERVCRYLNCVGSNESVGIKRLPDQTSAGVAAFVSSLIFIIMLAVCNGSLDVCLLMSCIIIFFLTSYIFKCMQYGKVLHLQEYINYLRKRIQYSAIRLTFQRDLELMDIYKEIFREEGKQVNDSEG
jgi:hypothetical protein